MKKLSFICIVCLCATTQTNAQLRDTTLNMNMHKVDANSLSQKSKKQKTVAWILLGGGVGIAAAGLIIESTGNPVNVWNNLDKRANGLEIFLITGGAAVLGSIPFFIASGNNRRKANLMLINENVFFNPQLNIKEHIVALGIKINL